MTDRNTASAASGDILHESKITPVQWVILLLCMVATMIEGFDIVIIAYTSPAISQDWGISPKELGVVLSAGVLGMTLGAMLLSWVADRYGRCNVVSLTLLIAGLATAAVIYTDTVTELVVLRLIAGLSLGVLVAALPALAGEFSPRRHRTLIIAILIAGGSAGAVVGGFISAALIAEHGWQSIFLYAGVLTVILAALVKLLIPESIAFTIKRKPEGALEKINLALIRIGQAPIAQLPSIPVAESQESATVVSLLTAKRRATTLLLWTAFFFSFVVVYFVSSWIPQILVKAGISQARAIQSAAILPLGSIVGTVLIGALAKWWALGRIIAVGLVLGALGIFSFSGFLQDLATMSIAVIWTLLFLIGISLMGAFSNLYALSLAVYPVQIRSTGLGWSAGLGRAGAVISPAIAGVMMGMGVPTPILFLCFAIPAFVAALCVSFIHMRELP